MKALLKMKNGGDMFFELFPEKTPITVKNFVSLVSKGFYDGLSFHRVVKDYVIQGGSADNTCMCPTDFTITGEFAENGYDTGLEHVRGALSMARDDDFDSAGTQFFVVHQDAHKLDGRYAAFGMLIEGFDVLDSIAAVETAAPEQENRPRELQIIKSITIIEKD
ncbi:MAG: peptidylprolyl isomerase [Spirochaetes bacterium]|nr:MAG: peptidylprolyl isomerase [Spirochaetota bacterium]